MKPLRIATYNVNGVKGRLPVALRWLSETSPDVVCLQELKTSDRWSGDAAFRAIPTIPHSLYLEADVHDLIVGSFTCRTAIPLRRLEVRLQAAMVQAAHRSRRCIAQSW